MLIAYLNVPSNFPRQESDLYTPKNSVEEINHFVKSWILDKAAGGISIWHYQPQHKTLDLWIPGRGKSLDENLHISCSGCSHYSGKTSWGNVSLDISAGFEDYGLILIRDEKANLLIKCRGITLCENVPFHQYRKKHE